MSAALAAASAEGSEQSRLPQSGFSPGPATGHLQTAVTGCFLAACLSDAAPTGLGRNATRGAQGASTTEKNTRSMPL
jgi:hypothetical protein